MPRIQGWVGREEKYVHFMNACWKTNHKNCAHGDRKGEKQLGEKWPIGRQKKRGEGTSNRRRDLLWVMLPAPESMVSYH